MSESRESGVRGGSRGGGGGGGSARTGAAEKLFKFETKC